MSLVTVDTNDTDLMKPPEFRVVSKGDHLFEVANDLKVTPCKEGDNSLIKLEARCQDEGEDKGAVVYHNFIIMKNCTTDGQKTAKKINQAQLAQFAVACGVCEEADFEPGGSGEIPLDEFKGAVFKAKTTVVANTYKGETKDKAEFSRFLFEPKNSEEVATPASE